MRFKMRRTRYFGPLRLTINQSGRVTWGLKIGPWSWSAATRKHTIDTPGPGYVQTSGRKRRAR